MVEDKKQALKKFIRNHTLVVLVILVLLCILLLLVGFRLQALASIGDLTNINPLITSDGNKLVVKDGTSEVIKIPTDDGGTSAQSTTSTTQATASPSASPAANQTSARKTTTGSAAQSSGGGSSSGSSGSTGNTGSPSPSPVPTVAAFTAGIGSSVTYETSNKSSYPGGCTITYKFTFTVTAQNAPGVAKAQWRWPGSTWGNEFNVSFTAGQTSVPISLQQYVSANTSDQVISLRLNSPNAVEKDYEFKHQC